MKNSDRFQPITHLRTALTLSAAVGLLIAAPLVRADDSVTMAPPIQPSISQSNDGTYNDGTYQDVSQDTTNTSQDSVFNWTEVPQNQRVPLTRAVFDKGGYQLYDTQGETIIVPFANQNLYVMKFGLSDDGSTYFENEGTVPVLYIPRDGYLENASAPGTRWFPFPKEYHYAQPVFLGVAPSYVDFVDMGWYPGMVCYGGYYSHTSFISGGIFLPTIGLSFFIGGHPYYGWHGYHHYYDNHPAPYHVTIVNNNFYHNNYNHFGGRPGGFGDRPFNGTGHPYYAGRSFGGRSFANGQHSGVANGGRSFGGGNGGRSFGGGGQTIWAHRTFRGVPGSNTNVRSFGSSQPEFGGSHASNGARHFGGGDNSLGSPARPSGQSFGGGSHTFNGASHTFNSGGSGGRSFGGGQSSPTAHTTSSGGGRSFGGGQSSNRSGGGGRSASGGQSNRGGGGQSNRGGGDHR
jgi:hypothetical protein